VDERFLVHRLRWDSHRDRAARHGWVHRLGLHDAQVARRLDSGSWYEAGPHVVGVSGGADTALRRVWRAALAAGTCDDGTERPVAVGGLAAAALLGAVADVPDVVEVVVARGVWCPRLDGLPVREVKDWKERAFVRRDGLLLTALPDTLVDVAVYFGDEDYLALLQQQCFGRFGLLARVVGRCHRGSKGSARARRVGAVLARGLDSPLHAGAVRALTRAGLAPHRCDVQVVRGVGPSDCVYDVGGVPAVALEFDGDVHRLSRQAFLHDRAKDLALREAGCVTLRFTAAQVDRPARLVADVRRALESAARAALPASSELAV
jgi:hypothetical protein